MNHNQLTGPSLEFYNRFQVHKPLVDIVGDEVIFTWHLVDRPGWSALTINRTHDRRATQRVHAEAQAARIPADRVAVDDSIQQSEDTEARG